MAANDLSGMNVLVTGATGFIGRNLVRRLEAKGCNVSCLVRSISKSKDLIERGCRLFIGDVTDAAVLSDAVSGQDFVFHLAGKTNSWSRHEMTLVNVGGTRTLLSACSLERNPPTVVLISSLAAAGPSEGTTPKAERDECSPVSLYGESKLEAEQVALDYSTEIPISVVRPSIVLGAGDRVGLDLFKSIDRLGIHVVPGQLGNRFSVIHVDDLTIALCMVAESGERLHLGAPKSGQGIYFASADETPTYEKLGELIAKHLGNRKVRTVRVPTPIMRFVGSVNSGLAKLARKTLYLDKDKVREALAGSWHCSNSKITSGLGFQPERPLDFRIRQTISWYRRHGWLKSKTYIAEAGSRFSELTPD